MTRASDLKEIPKKFHGAWVVDKQSCDVEGREHDGDIFVDATTISFHAEPYRIKTLSKKGDKIMVTYTPPEQEFMVPPETLYLSADGSELSDLWQRCPIRSEL